MEEWLCSRDSFERFWKSVPEGSRCLLRVTGTSMQPTLRHERDCVLLKRISGKEAEIYDIVLFQRSDGSWVLHRLIGKKEFCIMNGDAQTWTECIPEERILGKAIEIYRAGKRPVKTSHPLCRLYVLVWVHLRRLRPLIFRAKGKWNRLTGRKKAYDNRRDGEGI